MILLSSTKQLKTISIQYSEYDINDENDFFLFNSNWV